MVQADPSSRERTSPTQHVPEQSPARGPTVTRTFYLILFPRELEDKVVLALEELGLPGYTEFAKLTGRGPRGRHFDNPVWPGSEGSSFTVVGPEDGAIFAWPWPSLARSLKVAAAAYTGCTFLPGRASTCSDRQLEMLSCRVGLLPRIEGRDT